MLTIVTAFKTEALPIIDHFSLKRNRAFLPYQVFTTTNIQLGISGMGSKNSARLTRTLLESKTAASSVTAYWVNFGIAGSAGWEPGKLVFARTVTEVSTGRIWDLEAPSGKSGYHGDVYTCVSPQYSYNKKIVYEMEASGMLSELDGIVNSKQIFVLKLISDGPSKPLDSLSKTEINQVIGKNKGAIIDKIETIAETACI